MLNKIDPPAFNTLEAKKNSLFEAGGKSRFETIKDSLQKSSEAGRLDNLIKMGKNVDKVNPIRYEDMVS